MKAIFFFAVLFTSFMAKAQSSGGAIFFRMIYNHVQNAGKNFHLISPTGIDGFSDDFYGIGADGYYKFDKLIAGAGLFISGQGPSSKDNKYAEPFVGAGHVYMGYIVWNNRRVWAYPLLGAGFSGAALTSFQKTNSYKSNLHTVYLYRPSIDLGGSLDWIVYTFSDGRSKGSFMMSFKGGYRYSGRSSAWTNNTEEPRSVSAAFTNNAYYFSVSVGLGLFSDRNPKN